MEFKTIDWTRPIGGTKFLLAGGAACACSVLVWFGKIDGFIFRDVVLGCVGAYIVGNVAAKWKNTADQTKDKP